MHHMAETICNADQRNERIYLKEMYRLKEEHYIINTSNSDYYTKYNILKLVNITEISINSSLKSIFIVLLQITDAKMIAHNDSLFLTDMFVIIHLYKQMVLLKYIYIINRYIFIYQCFFNIIFSNINLMLRWINRNLR